MSEIFDWSKTEYKEKRRKASRIFAVMLFATGVVSSVKQLSDAVTAEGSALDRQAAAAVIPEARDLFNSVADSISGEDIDVICFIPESYRKAYYTKNRGLVLEGLFVPEDNPLDFPVPIRPATIYMRSVRCDDIMEYQASVAQGFVTPLIEDRAELTIYILAHELAHKKGMARESAANCGAVKLMPSVAHLMGMDELTDLFDPLEYVRSLAQPPEYHADGC